jgi:protein SCO1
MPPDTHTGSDGGTPAQPRPQGRGAPLPRGAVWIAACAALVAAGAAAVVWAHVWHRPALQGGVVEPPAPAYDFSLRDQDGRLVRLGTLRGKAVALTFLYTHCPDVCPLIANKMHEAYRQLGDGASRVVLVAVSVDPRGDTPDAVRAFLANHHVAGELAYLTGSFAELKPVWAGYFIGTDARPATPNASPTSPSPELVSHSAIVYVLDPRGNLRVFLPGNFDPQDLATDLRILAQEPGK